jgi:hypothetical protein
VETTVAGGDSGSGVYIDSGFGPALYGLSTVALTLNGSSSGTFGSGGGGLVLANQPYLDWLQAQTGGTRLDARHGSSGICRANRAWPLHPAYLTRIAGTTPTHFGVGPEARQTDAHDSFGLCRGMSI